MTHIITWLAIIGGTAFLVWGCKGFPVPYQPRRKRTRKAAKKRAENGETCRWHIS